MGLKMMQTIRCPECGAEHDFSVWNSVNVTVDPALKDKVKSGDIFHYVCPECNNAVEVIYPLLYHDMDAKLMIYYAPDAEALENAQKAFGDVKTEAGYTRRVVSSLFDLQEKIAISDAGLDDRNIEILKVFLGSELQETQPEMIFDDLLYFNGEDGSKGLALMREGNSFAAVGVTDSMYNEIHRRFGPLLEEHSKDETMIDLNWVMKSIGNM